MSVQIAPTAPSGNYANYRERLEPYQYSMCAPDGDFYGSLAPDVDSVRDRMGLFIEVAESVSSFEEKKSKVLFKLKHLPVDSKIISIEMMKITGAWPVADHLNSVQNGMRWVNPHSDDAWMYSDAYTRCECGALVSSVELQPHFDQNLGVQCEHDDDCPRIDRWEAKREFWQNRREVMIDHLYHGNNTFETGVRAGYSSGELKREYAHDHKVDHIEMIEEAKRRIARTAARNLHLYSPGEMAPAFGISNASMTKWLNDLGIDLGEMYNIRLRRGGSSE